MQLAPLGLREAVANLARRERCVERGRVCRAIRWASSFGASVPGVILASDLIPMLVGDFGVPVPGGLQRSARGQSAWLCAAGQWRRRGVTRGSWRGSSSSSALRGPRESGDSNSGRGAATLLLTSHSILPLQRKIPPQDLVVDEDALPPHVTLEFGERGSVLSVLDETP